MIDAVPHISVVIPIYNEQENLPELYKRLTKVLCGELKHTYEIILVDDGSSDQSWHIIESLHAKDKNIKGVKLSKNYGHHSALTAGLNHATGNIIVIMDGDLQARPEDIPLAVMEIMQGYDVIWAVTERRKDGIVATTGAILFKKIFRLIGDIKIPPNLVFLVLSRRALEGLKKYRERRRLIAGIFAEIGFMQKRITVIKDKRFRGPVKYTFRKRLRLAVTAIIGYSKFPLRMASYLGLVLSSISIIYAVWIVINVLVHKTYALGWPSVIVSIAFLGGIQLIVLGLIGEYLGVVIDEVKKRPVYLVDKILPGSLSKE